MEPLVEGDAVHSRGRSGLNNGNGGNKGVIVFMGTGGMWSYSVGFVAYMREHFGAHLDRCLFSATSGGTMPAALACQPRDAVDSFDWHKYTMVEGMREMQDDWTFANLYPVLGRRCKEFAKDFAKDFVRDNGGDGGEGHWHTHARSRLFIPYWSTKTRGEVVASEWKCTDDLIDCVLAACHIPVVIDGRYAAAYGDDAIYDIGLPWGYAYHNPAPELPFLYIGPRNQFRHFPKSWQSIYRDPLYTQFLYDQGYRDAKRYRPFLEAFFARGEDVYLGENDIPDKYGLRGRWHRSPVFRQIADNTAALERIETTSHHVYGNTL